VPSSGKKKTTMAKLDRERRQRERRAEKEARKEARRLGLLPPSRADEYPAVDSPAGSGAPDLPGT
jgi:hypothetical protein